MFYIQNRWLDIIKSSFILFVCLFFRHILQTFSDKMLLQRFLRATQGDVEAAKKLIDLNYTMRTNYSHIFLKRDPCDEATQRVLDTT